MLRVVVTAAAGLLLSGCAAVAVTPSPASTSSPSGAVTLSELAVPQGVCTAVDDLSSPSAFEQSLRDYVDCARQSWELTLTAVGLETPNPAVYVQPSDAGSACAGQVPHEGAALFCPSDGSIIFSDDLLSLARGWDLTAPRIVFHEYAHAVQHRIQPDREPSTELEVRRVELQAACWSAMLLRTLDGLEVTDAVRADLATEVGSSSDGEHGSPELRTKWTMAGLDATLIGDCDAFAVPDSAIT